MLEDMEQAAPPDKKGTQRLGGLDEAEFKEFSAKMKAKARAMAKEGANAGPIRP